MRRQTCLALIVVLAAGVASGDSAAVPLTGELIASWNEVVLTVAEKEDRFLTLKGLRTTAMMHLAVHDALNSIEPRYARWLQGPADRDADPVAAAASAAFAVASSQYPDQLEVFAAERERWLRHAAAGPARSRGIALGNRTAGGLLANREQDGWNGEIHYQWHPMAPGVYAEFSQHSGTPSGFIFGAGWAAAAPFVLPSAAYFRSPPPPAITSPAYTTAFNEVKDVGAAHSDRRTPDQAHLAMWWKEFVESSYNRLARELIAEEKTDLWTAARLLALLNVSVYDAYLSVFNNKFFYNHWRPYTAIRWASKDGNPATAEDPDWDNLHQHTYAFPSYPSAHGCACAAAATVLIDTFGDRPVRMVTERVDRAGPLSEKIPMSPPVREFPSLSAAAEECSLSRIYLGIHFRYDSAEGTRLGRQIGEHVLEHALSRR